MRVEFGGKAIELTRGDLTREATDAIVNAANPSLLGGGGVDGAIHRAGGPEILAQCRTIRAERGPLERGDAVVTTGGRLAARFVIHTAGPVWAGGLEGEPGVLARCYRTALELADGYTLRSVAFPSISTGVYGYPVGEAASVAVAAVRDGLAEARHVVLARFVLFDEPTLAAYRAALERLA